jgi:hypothetical protein
MNIGDRVKNRTVFGNLAQGGSSAGQFPLMELIYLGTVGHREFFMWQESSSWNKVSSWVSNPTNEPITASYQETSGSEIGFSQSVGLSATCEINLPGIGSASSTVTVEVGFSQMFSKETSTGVEFTVGPKETLAVWESQRKVKYFWGLPGMAEGTVPSETNLEALLNSLGETPEYLNYPVIGSFMGICDWSTETSNTQRDWANMIRLYPGYTNGVIFYADDTLSGSIIQPASAMPSPGLTV